MKPVAECFPCLLNQAIEAAHFHQLEDPEILKLTKLCTRHLLKSVHAIETNKATSPEVSVGIHKLVKKITGNPDPYLTEKKESNRRAADLVPSIEKEIKASKNPLVSALFTAAAANIMDSGIPGVSDPVQAFHDKLSHPIDNLYFHSQDFINALGGTNKLLILGDNAGEIFLDSLLIDFIKKDFPTLSITYAVRGKAILNDALIEDAILAGIDKKATLISNGDGTPGTSLKTCSKAFKKRLLSASLILSKGQGNYETLSDTNLPIFFLLTAKCPVVSRSTSSPLGSTLLIQTTQSV